MFTSKFVWESNIKQENEVILARNTFTLKDVPTSCEIKFTADKYYRLYINGKHICRGPVRSGFDYRFYDIVDIAPYLSAGENTLAIVAWYYDIYYFDYQRGRPMFLCEGQVEGHSLDTPGSWKMILCEAYDPHPTRMTVCTPFSEFVDMTKFPHGWNQKEFDDKDWKSFEILSGDFPWKTFIERDIDFLHDEIDDTTFTLERADRVKSLPESYYLDLNLKLGWYPMIIKDAFLYTTVFCEKQTAVTFNYICDGDLTLYANGEKIEISESNLGRGFRAFSFTLNAGQNQIMLASRKYGYFWFIHYVIESEEPLFYGAEKHPDRPDAWSIAGPFDGITSDEKLDEFIKSPENINGDTIPTRLNPSMRVTLQTPEKPLNIGRRFPYTIQGGSDVTVVFDAGGLHLGFPIVTIETQEDGVIADISYNEDLENGIHVPASYGSINYSDRMICTKGENTFEGNFLYKGFRYMAVTLRNVKTFAKIKSIRLNAYNYNLPAQSTFVSSDDTLNEMWNIGARTLKNCMSDAYMDCGSREQAFYIGDLFVELISQFYTYGDSKLAACNSRFLPYSQYDSGFFPAVSPRKDGDGSDVLLDQSMDVVTNTLNYVLFSGDLSVAQDLDNALEKQIAGINKFWTDRNLIENVQAPFWIDHLLWEIYSNGVNTPLNMRYYYCLGNYAKLSEMLGKPERANKLREQAAQLKEAINTHLRYENSPIYFDGIYDNGQRLDIVSVQAMSMAVVYGIADQKDFGAIIEHLENDPNVRPSKNPFFYYTILDAYYIAGRQQRAMEIMKEKWGLFMDAGWDTWPETWGEHFVSRSHAYSNGPTILLAAQVLGIVPTDAGMKKISFSPRTDMLDFANLEVPSPMGRIFFGFENKDGKTLITVNVPNGCEVTYTSKKTGNNRILTAGQNIFED